MRNYYCRLRFLFFRTGRALLNLWVFKLEANNSAQASIGMDAAIPMGVH